MSSVTCPRCGTPGPVGKKFCEECGNALPRTCHSCGAPVGMSAKFCGECAAPLQPGPAFSATSDSPPVVPVSGQPGPVPHTPTSLTATSSRSGRADRPAEERRLVTALFCDLVGFTPLSERLDPEEVRDIQGEYFGRMVEQIERYGGIVDKYAGDAVLALFGTLVTHEDDAERAVLCALGMQGAIEEVAARARQEWQVDPAIRVGVNTGEVVSGVWDASEHQGVTVTGDAVNVAARLQVAAEPDEVLVGIETMRLTRRRIEYGERRDLALKGKASIVPAYPALGLRERFAERWEDEDLATPLVGRERELLQLLDTWMRVQSGEGGLVTLVGEPGVGKSRLVAELVDKVSSAGAVRVVRARCLSYGQDISLWLLADLLRSLFGIREQDALHDIHDKLGTVVPALLSGAAIESQDEAVDVLGEVLGLAPANSMVSGAGAEIRRQALIRSLRSVLRALAERAPWVLVLEDLHWIDTASEDVLREIVSDVPGLQLLVLVTQRPGWTAPWSELSWPERLVLRPLREEDAALLAGTVLGGLPLSAMLLTYIAERAGGNPFFVEELLHALQETGGITQRNGHMDLVADVAQRLPITLTEVLLARLDRLEVQVRKVAQVGSVIGRTFAVRLLAEVIGREQTALEMPLAALQEAEIAFPRRGLDLEYAFKHVTMREVAYNTLVQKRRKELHLHTARAIAALYPSDEYAELVAYHYARTDAHAEAVPWLERAGDRAAAIYSNDTAVAGYRETRRRLEFIPGEEHTHARLAEKLGGTLTTAGHYEEALPILEEAIEAYQQVRDLEGAGRTTALLGLTHRRRGTPEEGLSRVKAMLDVLQWSGPSRALASLHLAMANLFLLVGRYPEMLPEAERAAEVARTVKDERLLGEAEMRRGTALTHLRRPEEAHRVLEGALPLVEAGGDLTTLLFAWNNLGAAAARLGWMDRMRSSLERALSVAERIGNPNYVCFVLGNLGTALVSLGEWDRARDVLDRGVALGKVIGHTTYVATPLIYLGQLAVWKGDWDEAKQVLNQAQAMTQETNDRHQREDVEACLAELELLQGHPLEAIARLEPLVAEGVGELGLLLPLLAWAYLATGQEEQLSRAEHLAENALGLGREQPAYLVNILWVYGMVLTRQRRFTEAETVLTEGLELARSMPMPHVEARILVEMDTMSRERGDQDATDDRLEEALTIFQRLGAKKDAERTGVMLRRNRAQHDSQKAGG